MRIYLIRHGETELNRRKCYYGVTDPGLSPEGIRQARAFRDYFRGMSWDRVVVSPLERALQTAGILTGDMEYRFEKEERLKEQNFGIFEGRTYEELSREYPEELAAWNADFSHYRIPGGESFSDVRARVEEWTASLTQQEGNMLVVAHKGTLGHMVAAMLGLDLEGYWNFVFEQGCYSLLDLEDGYAILRKLNQTITAVPD